MENQQIVNFREKYNMPLEENRIVGVDYAELYRKIEIGDKENNPFNEEEKKAYKNMKQREDYYKDIDLVHVFKKLNGVWRAKDKFRVSSGNVIHTDMQTWKYVSGPFSEKKGRFGPSFLATELNLNAFQIIDWYTENFGVKYDPSLMVREEFLGDMGTGGANKNSKLFSPPTREDENWNSVFRYLNEDRNIPESLLNDLYKNGKIYADRDSRCIFLSNASAEIRGTPASSNPDFKGCTQGGQADVSGFSVMPQLNANESVIAITEAAIDAASYNALFPGRYVFSSNGSGRFELHYKIALEALSNGFSLSLATDADEAGDIAAQKVFNALLIRQYIYNKYNKEFGVKYKEIDEAIINGKISIEIEASPHRLFFNDKNVLEEYPIYERVQLDNNKIVMQDTGTIGGKVFAFQIADNAFEFSLNTEKVEVGITTNQVNYMIDKMKVKRDRPPRKKDWNAELSLLGSEYLNEYEKLFKDGFEILPKLPECLSEMRKSINPIRFDDKGNAIIVSKEDSNNYNKEPNKQQVNSANKRIEKNIERTKEKEVQEIKPVSENITQEETKDPIFKANYSRQELFNIIYLRFLLNQKHKIPFNEIDENIRNKDYAFFLRKDQPYLNFVDSKWNDKIEYVAKQQEEGDPVYKTATIKYFDKKQNKSIELPVVEKAFYRILEIMDDIAKKLSNSADQKEVLNSIGFNCFNESKESGLPLTTLLGNGRLIEKQENTVAKNQPVNRNRPSM